MTMHVPCGPKNFIELALSCTASKINAFYHFTQNLKMATKYGRKTIFDKKWPMTLYTLGVKNVVEIILSCTISEVFVFNAEIQDGHQKWRENKFSKKCQTTLCIPWGLKNFVKIIPPHTVSEKKAFLSFMQKFMMAGKNEFWRKGRTSLHIPWGQKFCQNRCTSHRFNAFLSFMQNSRWTPNIAGKMIFGKK